MNIPFYATIMMVTGEEVLAHVMSTEEHGIEFLVLQDAIVVEESIESDATGNIVNVETPRKWMRFNDDVVVVHMDKVITISEMDKYATKAYKAFLLKAKLKSPIKREEDTTSHTGYLGSISEQRKYLENLLDKESSND